MRRGGAKGEPGQKEIDLARQKKKAEISQTRCGYFWYDDHF